MADPRPDPTPPEPATADAPGEQSPQAAAADGLVHHPEDEQVRLATYEAVVRSTARVVEDTSEQLRQLASLSTAASGVALRMMLAGDKPAESARAMAEAQRSVQEAADLFQRIGRVSLQLLERFQPPLPPSPAPPAQPEPDDTPGRKP
jgi:hypothetical protein